MALQLWWTCSVHEMQDARKYLLGSHAIAAAYSVEVASRLASIHMCATASAALVRPLIMAAIPVLTWSWA